MKRSILRRVIVLTLYVLIMSFIQSKYPIQLSLFGIKPDFQLVLVVLCSYRFKYNDGIAVALGAGFIRDVLSAQVFGSGMLLLFLVATIVHLTISPRLNINVFSFSYMMLLVTLGYDLLTYFIQFIYAVITQQYIQNFSLYFHVVERLLPQILFNIVVGAILFGVIYLFGPYPRYLQKAWVFNMDSQVDKHRAI